MLKSFDVNNIYYIAMETYVNTVDKQFAFYAAKVKKKIQSII